MLEACVKAVKSLFKAFGKLPKVSTASTGRHKYLTSQVFSVLALWTAFEQLSNLFTQAFSAILSLLWWVFCTSSTSPITNTKLIKDY